MSGGSAEPLRLFLCGDVMTGRGIDQALAHPVSPELYEPFVRDARDYLRLAEQVSGPLDTPLRPDYPWGDALPALAAREPDVRIVNLETSITGNDEPWPGKGINYRMHPDNLDCVAALRPECLVLANNHVMDWGRPGLDETLQVLERAGLRIAGAGRDMQSAAAPAVVPLSGGARLLVFAACLASSGVPGAWAAGPHRAGVNLLPDLGAAQVEALARDINDIRRPGDRVLVSLHWGGNWGYPVAESERDFARRLVDEAGVDLVHGHSSHHPRPCEVYGGRLILYGCGDFMNDYEGIGGHEAYRPDLVLGYLAELDPVSGALRSLELLPFQLRRLRLNRASAADAAWIASTLSRECRPFGCRIGQADDGRWLLEWAT